MEKRRAIVWFRNDLRLHDHESLHAALQSGAEVLAVYCLDPRLMTTLPLGFRKTEAFRMKFLLEALHNLSENLQKIGSQLLVLQGKPEEILPNLVQKYHIHAIYASKEITEEEIIIENALEKALWTRGVRLEFFWTSTLLHLEDLPFPIHCLPDVFTQFRKQVEKQVKIRPMFPYPQKIMAIRTPAESETIPSLESLGYDFPTHEQRGVLHFEGGETAGLQRLKEYFWEKNTLKNYKETRNGLLGADYSSKFSAWLALGCLSPRMIYYEIKRYEETVVQNDSTYWLIFELLWRDYFKFVAKKFGKRLFLKEGIRGSNALKLRQHKRLFSKWKEGQTGVPFIDANMKELMLTGFMSNRGRQNVASFLVKDLGIDWRWGASYFEAMLLDYDVCSNWGNWNYVAGVGNDPRENRYFNILSQAKNYDPQGEYVKHWLPELTHLPASKIHTLGLLSKAEQKQYKITLGVDYPLPTVNIEKWLKKSY